MTQLEVHSHESDKIRMAVCRMVKAAWRELSVREGSRRFADQVGRGV